MFSEIYLPQNETVYTPDLKVRDSDGFDTFRLEVNINGVNDNPEIKSFTPNSNLLNLKENQTENFFVEVEDPENDDFKVVWRLNGNLVLENLVTYLFKAVKPTRNSFFSYICYAVNGIQPYFWFLIFQCLKQ